MRELSGLFLWERQHRHEDPTVMTSPKPVYLSKASPLQVRTSTYEFQRNTNIQSMRLRELFSTLAARWNHLGMFMKVPELSASSPLDSDLVCLPGPTLRPA